MSTNRVGMEELKSVKRWFDMDQVEVGCDQAKKTLHYLKTCMNSYMQAAVRYNDDGLLERAVEFEQKYNLVKSYLVKTGYIVFVKEG